MEYLEPSSISTDQIEQWLIQSESGIAQIRANQMALIAEIDRRQVPLADGCRSLTEWVASRMDVAPETASDLVQTTRRLVDRPQVATGIASGDLTFDRTVTASRFDGDDPLFELDIAGIRRRVAHRRMLTPQQETDAYLDHYFVAQPSLNEHSVRMHGRLPGADGMLVLRALQERGDHFGDVPSGPPLTRGQRNADALVAMAQDSLDGDSDIETATGSNATIFVDATGGQPAGAQVEFGPSVGPAALQEVLCSGSVQVVGIGQGRPVAFSNSSRAIPPAVRRFVSWRDGGCCADGCTSQYRLQPHHVIRHADGGTSDPNNLRMFCWFHHHVVIHQHGFRIEPSSPVGRTRFLPPANRRRAPP